MIRAEELMLGDFVTVNRSECVADGGHYATWKEDGKIILLEKDFARVQYEVDKDDDWDDWEEVEIKDLEPIPITPEILEENGFKKEDNDCYLWNESLEKIIWFCDGVTTITSIRCDRIYEGHCYNVHELQHALKLCGILKTIEL